MTIPKLPQTITFGTIPTQSVGTSLNLTATASSGLTVTYSATSNPSGICSVTGSKASFTGAGSCTITASQIGNGTYAAATPVTQTFNVVSTTYGSVSPSSLTLTYNPGFFIFIPPSAVTGTVTLSGTNLPTTTSSWTLSGLPSTASYTVTSASSTSVVFTLNSGTTSVGATTVTINNGGKSTGKTFALTIN